ncbi:hypothetical protein TGAM01_v206156 [Trichoderma gamsii]|uniref:Uncharacterized protein n=1 Tax=Trichoderma gamsii TaxID=398673 RepID=A0A2P4ZLF7_9HYPO|nr:hypothetical protein TGAM01_v206156 [Trichoderma gamsii]PON25075.1 hypothetical protein TGAM01_v206156 [Trichoderma gamsii]
MPTISSMWRIISPKFLGPRTPLFRITIYNSICFPDAIKMHREEI